VEGPGPFVSDLPLGDSVGSLKGMYMTGWGNVFYNYSKRLEQLKYFKIPKPFGFLLASSEPQKIEVLLWESFQCYLLNLPNASLPLIIRVLEIALKQKFQNKSQQNLRLVDLIDLAEAQLKEKKEMAHAFRRLRNIIHENTLISEQTSLDALRYISDIVNTLYPSPQKVRIPMKCPYCGKQGKIDFQSNECYIGNEKTYNCKCGKTIYPLIL